MFFFNHFLDLLKQTIFLFLYSNFIEEYMPTQLFFLIIKQLIDQPAAHKLADILFMSEKYIRKAQTFFL